ncbi:bifunctional phosphoribosylaminoimidazolecarboxamide formyltransferase/IMP cyclohydrolase [Ornithobacterium rhinotracheale]|uniref:bifunctional phosphoribosylaminoimidazolecarboxamide formyltransferase/IMP cyclohydrolase n=1 Tax=Ornithobacterium rhinotracheale TaxID=28251 RepID=UPI001FF5C946|nr:bifunctional phosphoribosylaminoimidazolecarboxamide formyltransferase/IMP cyclohydrolase [Ornithobacterium rhinotracheale]MCK0200302.1 bifunctional phosphoribosylaminoimidazolecarboxamide formyltransferase/IMP cyclohydrolase [Ornithobacterium rhinotracheale]
MQKTALLSVSNKAGITAFAQFLESQNYQLLSTGGTYKHLKEAGINVKEVSQITEFPEILNGRVKTLHPHIHGGILARRNDPQHMQTLADMGISTIDMVVVNLYPFFENADKDLSMEELVEFIDIGGPTMLRAAAKSFFDVTVITDNNDYALVQKEIENQGETSLETRKNLAGKVFNLTSAYDAAIAQKLLNDPFPPYYSISFQKEFDLRYGENLHQAAAYYTSTFANGALKNFMQHQGKELSFNNIRDLDLAWKVVCEFDQTACCAVKHSTPCGVALDDDILQAYQKAHDCDPISIFGGIVTFNKKVTKAVAEKCNEIFLEIVAAPSFEPEALEVFAKKKNLRVIEIKNPLSDKMQLVQVDGGLLVQEIDKSFSNDFKVVTEKQPTEKQLSDLEFAMKVVKHVKSNAIVVATNGQALGVGTGETNRIWAAQQAIQRAKEKTQENLVLASDAFFPFRDVVDYAAQEGITALIHPGGSMRDQESIDAANEHGIPMIISGMRHFLH